MKSLSKKKSKKEKTHKHSHLPVFSKSVKDLTSF